MKEGRSALALLTSLVAFSSSRAIKRDRLEIYVELRLRGWLMAKQKRCFSTKWRWNSIGSTAER